MTVSVLLIARFRGSAAHTPRERIYQQWLPVRLLFGLRLAALDAFHRKLDAEEQENKWAQKTRVILTNIEN